MATFTFKWRGYDITAHAPDDDPIPTLDTINGVRYGFGPASWCNDEWDDFLSDWESYWDSEGNSGEFENMTVDGDSRF
jgi:hypothetical protein